MLRFIHVSHGGDDLKASFCGFNSGQDAKTAGAAGDKDFFILIVFIHSKEPFVCGKVN